MSKDDYVQTGVILLCDKGAVPVPFVATIKKKNHHGMTGGTIRDDYPVLNIPPFGVCSITTLPCLPVMPKWENYPGEPWYIENYQPLMVSSYCKCKAGGTIKIYASYQDAFAALDDNKKSRVDGIPWVDRIICGVLMPGMAVGNVITGRDHETQGVGRGIRQGLKKTFLGLWDVVSHPLDTLGGLATLAAVGVVGYSQPGMVIIASPQERLQKFDSIFKTKLAETDTALKNAVVETVDQKLINGTETERAEFTGELVVAIADIAFGGKGSGAMKKMATSTARAANTAGKAGKFGKAGINAAKLVDDIGSVLNKAGNTIKKWTWDKLPNPIKGIFGKKIKLLPDEGKVGTYKDLIDAGKAGDNITPHHIPSNEYMKRYMKEHGKQYTTNDGICLNMEQPYPGSGGRHRKTQTYNNMSKAEKEAYYKLSPKEALEKDIDDVRKIYKDEGLYTKEVEESLQKIVKQNEEKYPDLYK